MLSPSADIGILREDTAVKLKTEAVRRDSQVSGTQQVPGPSLTHCTAPSSVPYNTQNTRDPRLLWLVLGSTKSRELEEEGKLGSS